MTDFYLILSGPMMWVAVGVFISGTMWHVFRFHRFTRKKIPRPVRTVIPKSDPGQASNGFIDPRSFKYRLSRLKLTLPGQRPFFTLMTTLFHMNLLILPFFVQGHTMMVGFSFGIHLPFLPNAVVDLLTVITFLCVLFFLVRRFYVRQVRAITTFSDIALMALAAAPFVTGFMAYHQIYDYHTMILMHMVSGELILILIPFTRLIHMVYFFLNRFSLVHQYTLDVWANRAWKPDTDPFYLK